MQEHSPRAVLEPPVVLPDDLEPRPGSPLGSNRRFKMPNLADKLRHYLSDDPRAAASPRSEEVSVGSGETTTVREPAKILYDSHDLLPTIETAWEIFKDERPMIGRMHRKLTGGDLCEVFVDVSAHKYDGHSSTTKVRPTLGINHLVGRPREGHPPVSQVGPLCEIPPFTYPEDITEPVESLNDLSSSLPSINPATAGKDVISEITLYPAPNSSGEQTPVPSVLYDPQVDLPRWVAGYPLYSNENNVSPRYPVYSNESNIPPGASSWEKGSCGVYESDSSLRVAHDFAATSSMRTEGPTTPGEAFELILYPKPHAGSYGVVSDEHPGHSPVSKVQAFNDGAATPHPPSKFTVPPPELHPKRMESLRRLEKKKSASRLVPYWESVNKAGNHASPSSGEKHVSPHDEAPKAKTAQVEDTGFQWPSTCPSNKIAAPGATNHPTLRKVGHMDAPRSPPSVHESLASEIESKNEEPKAKHRTIIRGPKHYRSAPGMRSKNVNFSIPERTSSLFKARFTPSSWLGRPKDRFQDHSDSNVSPGHGLNTERSVPTLHEEDEPDSNRVPPKRSGCFGTGKIVRKIRSCRLPRSQSRPSFPRGMVDGPPPLDDDLLGIVPPQPARLMPPTWNYDGAADEDEWTTGDDVRQGAGDGHVSSEWQRPHSAPPASHDLSEPEQEGRLKTHGSMRINLRGRSHVSVREQGVNLARSYYRQPIARDWSAVRKQFVATVACLSTAGIGVLIGIYAGMVPSIQYWIADLEHYAILGNAFFYLGLAIPTFFFWPLPLLHGRKPYILSSLVLSMPLLFPQAITVSEMRSPYVSTWR